MITVPKSANTTNATFRMRCLKGKTILAWVKCVN
jgi:hypothetical protein